MTRIQGAGRAVAAGAVLAAGSAAWTWTWWPGGTTTLLDGRVVTVRLCVGAPLPAGAFVLSTDAAAVALLAGVAVGLLAAVAGEWTWPGKAVAALAGVWVAGTAAWWIAVLSQCRPVDGVLVDGVLVGTRVEAGLGAYAALAGGVLMALAGTASLVVGLFDR